LQLEEWLFGPYPHGFENLNSYWQNTYHFKDASPAPNQPLLTVATSLVRINSKSNLIQQFYEPIRILEVTDYFELDLYKGFLIKHEARINVNLTVELETWIRPSHHHAQVSKSNKLAKKIMQLDVSTDFDQKELTSRNFARILSESSEPVLILKISGTSHVENSTVNLTILWIDSNEKVQEAAELQIDDISITSINFAKSNLRQPLISGNWTVKVLQKKSLIGQTKFLVTPSVNATTKDVNMSHNHLDKMIANFYLIKDTCISYNHKNIRDIVGSYLNTNEEDKNEKNFHKFNECKKTHWSSLTPDPKSELVNDYGLFDGSS
jgi:protein xylosyltransferase